MNYFTIFTVHKNHQYDKGGYRIGHEIGQTHWKHRLQRECYRC